MSPRYRLTPLARRDVDDLLSYVQQQSGPRSARHVQGKLHDAFLKIAETPGIGHVGPT
ncbi:MAG TPA: type II toxin-antitoxin system RelE/ParE family toxin [Phycisphaerae bacterium]|nr:type II toxin-antitoxin system RelE/ParE family toxin [Phycisphaerae bacterium]